MRGGLHLHGAIVVAGDQDGEDVAERHRDAPRQVHGDGVAFDGRLRVIERGEGATQARRLVIDGGSGALSGLVRR